MAKTSDVNKFEGKQNFLSGRKTDALSAEDHAHLCVVSDSVDSAFVSLHIKEKFPVL